MAKFNYILTLDNTQNYNSNNLDKKLDLALDWLKLMPGVYFISSTSDVNKWYERIKAALPNNRFFITKVDISNDDYVGWLSRTKWDWIKKKK